MKHRVVLAFGLLLLTACSKTLDDDRIAQSIQQDVIKEAAFR